MHSARLFGVFGLRLRKSDRQSQVFCGFGTLAEEMPPADCEIGLASGRESFSMIGNWELEQWETADFSRYPRRAVKVGRCFWVYIYMCIALLDLLKYAELEGPLKLDAFFRGFPGEPLNLDAFFRGTSKLAPRCWGPLKYTEAQNPLNVHKVFTFCSRLERSKWLQKCKIIARISCLPSRAPKLLPKSCQQSWCLSQDMKRPQKSLRKAI